MPLQRWMLTAGFIVAGCQALPGPTPTPDRLAACEARFAQFDADRDRRWRGAEATRWLYEFPLIPTYGPCARAVAKTGVAEPSCPLPADPDVVVARLDRDGDGSLAREEACALLYEQVACEQRFAGADQDHDGAVSLAEFVAANPRAPDNPLVGADPPPPEITFKALDQDQSGMLSIAELCGHQRVSFALPTAGDVSGSWIFGTGAEPPAGPVFGDCPPGNGLRLVQSGEGVTGEEMVCGGPCYTPTRIQGTNREGRLALIGTPPDAGQQTVTYTLRFEAGSGHLVGTRDGQPFWAAPFVHTGGLPAPCPL